MNRQFFTTATALALGLCGPVAGLAYAVPAPGVQCARSLSLTTQALLRADARFLNRCLLAVHDDRGAFPADRFCATLRSSGAGIDQRDRAARKRIQTRCRRGLPEWLPKNCTAPGNWHGRRLETATDLAECAVRATHCAAVDAVSASFEAIGELLSGEHQGNTTFEYGDSVGNSLGSCLGGPGVTTTSTTTTLFSTTTSTLPGATSTTTTTIITPSVPMLVITEFMSNPSAQSDSAGEYFEVTNVGSSTVDLQGMIVSDLGSDFFAVDAPLLVDPGAGVVFVKSATAADGSGDYLYASGMNLTNSSDEIILTINATEIDRVVYDSGFPLTAGAATQLDPGATDAALNDAGSSWCPSTTAMSDGDSGSPGSVNQTCSP